MENTIDSNTLWCVVALLAFALAIASPVQARRNLGVKPLRDTSDCNGRGSWRNHGTLISSGATALRALGMIAGRVRLLPRNNAIRHIRAPAAPADGKEHTTC